jgi:serine protease Do
MAETGMQKHSRLVALAALAAAFLLGACDLVDKRPQVAAKPGNPPLVLGSAASSASGGSSQPPQMETKASGGGNQQVVPLPDFTPLMKIDGPAVVNVITTNKLAKNARPRSPARNQAQPDDDPMLEFFRRFMPGPGGPGAGAPGEDQGEPRGGLGSGFIISSDGYILTNAHVVADFDDVTVKLADSKREFKAKVIGVDKRTDVALIKVDAKDLPTVTLGTSAKLEPGQWVAAIGSPFGFANTITAGIVSATGRSLPDETYVPFIQTDVAVNPGNSGGPLINLKGEVVGINSLIYSRTGGYMGVSFAIPIEVALDVAKQLQASGKVTRGRLGVGVQPLTKELARSFKLDAASGAVVTAVEPGSPAAKAGVKVGDIILSYQGKAIEEPSELPRLVAATKPGEKAQLEVWRAGKRERLAVTVGEIPSEVAAAKGEKPATESASTDLGFAVRDLAPEERKALGVDYGLVVEGVTGGSAAGSSPIQPGDVILAVNQDRFRSVQEFNKLVAQRKKGENVALLVRRGDASVYVPIEIGTS